VRGGYILREKFSYTPAMWTWESGCASERGAEVENARASTEGLTKGDRQLKLSFLQVATPSRGDAPSARRSVGSLRGQFYFGPSKVP
jgi:hypothetical protein